MTVLFIPLISLGVGLVTNWKIMIGLFVILEALKFWLSKKENFNRKIWEYIFNLKMQKTAYYKLTNNSQFIKKGLSEIGKVNGNVWSKSKLQIK